MSAPLLSLLGDTGRAVDIWSAGRAGSREIRKRQSERLGDLVRFARRRSPFYRRLYESLPDDISDIGSLPPVSKTDLMASFDDWVTDREVTLDSVSLFVNDKGRIGDLFEDRYTVWKSSGTSGYPGIFLHDLRATAIYDQLFAQRAWTAFPFRITPAHWGQVWRMACVTACEDHFAAISSWRRLQARQPFLQHLMRDFSVLLPVDQLVSELNKWHPLQLVAYPSVLTLLAQEQAAGRLNLSPAVIFAGGETMNGAQQDLIESAFGCAVRCVYACSECDYIAFQCAHRNFHVNADWVILEPVDVDGQPVERGAPSHAALITNLANSIQPIIRYELGDSITVLAEACPCGNPLPAIRIEGRREEILHFLKRDNRDVMILPMAITTVLDLIQGLRRFQVIREDGNSIRIACEIAEAADETAVSQEIKSAVTRFLSTNGLDGIRISVDATPPVPDPVSGKFHQVVCASGG